MKVLKSLMSEKVERTTKLKQNNIKFRSSLRICKKKR